VRLSFLAAAVLTAVTLSRPLACEQGHALQTPSAGMVENKFGFKKHPLLATLRLHSGVDYAGAVGDPVFAAEAGTVSVAGVEGGYGKYVRIAHGKGLQSAYAHLSSFTVKPGDCAAKGQQIGRLGQTGISSGPHLHFEVLKNNRFIDPETVLGPAPPR
jgi:murein DD-endopeptidase MepM/ murein hydrolase activator NlpD